MIGNELKYSIIHNRYYPSVLAVLSIFAVFGILFSDLQSIQLPGSQERIGFINALAP